MNDKAEAIAAIKRALHRWDTLTEHWYPEDRRDYDAAVKAVATLEALPDGEGGR